MASPESPETQIHAPPLSHLGIGTALGAPSDEEDEAYHAAIRAALAIGLNHIDTAINYRCQRSERVIGRLLRDRGTKGSRLFVTTKGGYLPLESPPPESKAEYRAYIEEEYLETGIVDAADLVAGGHCIAPGFLRDQIERSHSNLCVSKIDIYYIHNPEQQLDAVSREEFDTRLRAAFTELEACVSDGLIESYGCATWNGLRVAPSDSAHLSIETLVTTAKSIAGDDHHFVALQMPINLAMMEGVRVPTQHVNAHERTALEAADELGVAMIAVAPLMQGRLALDLPPAARAAFPEATSDAACALSFVRMIPHVASVVVGMRSEKHVRENATLFM